VNILIVDDEEGLRHTLTLILGAEGHATRTAAEGGAALNALREQEADIVLCDVRMPGVDGLSFLDAYVAKGGRALIIMMSAYGDDIVALDAIRRGAHDFIQKPFRADQVLLVINKAIEREGLRKEVTRLGTEVAELRKVLERSIVIPDEPEASAGDNDLSVPRRSAVLERALIARALKQTGGNRTRAAKLLELSPRALLYKIKEYGLE
jgi:DNA-binding NtrC family response regulator